MTFALGVDIGGTFTDAVAIRDTGEIFTGKSDTTPHHFSNGVLDALSDLVSNARMSLPDLLRQTFPRAIKAPPSPRRCRRDRSAYPNIAGDEAVVGP